MEALDNREEDPLFSVKNFTDTDYRNREGMVEAFTPRNPVAGAPSIPNNGGRDIRGAEITAHEVLDNGLRKTSFSNGTIVYTNFSDTQQQTEFGPVAPRDFVTGEGQ